MSLNRPAPKMDLHGRWGWGQGVDQEQVSFPVHEAYSLIQPLYIECLLHANLVLRTGVTAVNKPDKFCPCEADVPVGGVYSFLGLP